jgi:N-sulfoglucosamine sulfohydrolase
MPIISKEIMNKPNILYIHSHDTGRYIQPYGYAVPTPNLQQLAQRGILFRNAFCAGPTCSPSRASLLTGMYPHNNGMLGLSHRGFSLNDYNQHIVHTLRQAGYFCALSGVQHVDQITDIASYGRRIGYDIILDKDDKQIVGEHPMAEQRAAQFLRNSPEQPFFLSVGFTETHRVFPGPHPDDDPNYCCPPAPVPDTPETRGDMAGFIHSARILDRKIGRVLDELDRTGLAENTLVICTTDHGIDFPNMKCNLTDHGTGVMLIMCGPGGFTGGKVIDAMVSHLDIFPTICELIEVEKPSRLQGKSILPLIRGQKSKTHAEIFTEVNFHAAYEPMRAVRTDRWKYIRRFDNRTRAVLPNCDDGPSKEVWLKHGWRNRTVYQEQLYDLIFDPNETNNLADDSAYSAIKTEMENRLQSWMRDTTDPLLKGPLAAPAGAILNSPDQSSHRDTTNTIPAISAHKKDRPDTDIS